MANNQHIFIAGDEAHKRPEVDRLSLTIVSLAWRNLWRNKRRTWLTVAGVAFAVWLLIFGRSAQEGTFMTMVDNGARMMTGHMQVQHVGYKEDPSIENTVNLGNLIESIRIVPGVDHVSARAQGFALVSQGERSFGAQILGVDPEAEGQWSTLKGMLAQGRYPSAPGEAMIGATLARNLALDVGSEMIVLGTALQGGVAAMSVQISGIFDATQPELNRSLVVVHLDDFREALAMSRNEAHTIVVVAEDVAASDRALEIIREKIDPNTQALLGWRDLMPEVEQMMDMKSVSTEVIFLVLAIIVTFSVVNTFMMVVFERTPEFGVLQAIGMQLKYLRWQLQIEAFMLSALGIAVGFGLSWALILGVGDEGLPAPIPEDAEAFYARFNMGTHIMLTFDWQAFRTASWVFLIGIQLGALLPGWRLRKLRPVDAIRQET